MTTKHVDIKLNNDGTSVITNLKKGEAPILISGEINATVFDVTFPKNFWSGYKYLCLIDGWDKQIILPELKEGVTNFTVPKLKNDTIKLGFCACMEEQNKIIKYVKWQGVQCTVINGGNKYVDL